MKTYLCSLILIVSLSVPAFAARPLVTDDFGTVDTGKYEFEIGYNSITPKTGGSNASGLVAQIKRGILPNFDLGLEIPYNLSSVSGLADTVAHAKLKLLEFGEDEGMTARADAKLTNGDAAQGLGSGYLDYGVLIIVSKKISGLMAHFNVGYVFVGDSSNSCDDDTFVYGAAIEKELFKDLGFAAEYTGVSCNLKRMGNLLVAGRWQALETVRFDIGYSMAMTDASNNIATAGLTAEF